MEAPGGMGIISHADLVELFTDKRVHVVGIPDDFAHEPKPKERLLCDGIGHQIVFDKTFGAVSIIGVMHAVKIVQPRFIPSLEKPECIFSILLGLVIGFQRNNSFGFNYF